MWSLWPPSQMWSLSTEDFVYIPMKYRSNIYLIEIDWWWNCNVQSSALLCENGNICLERKIQIQIIWRWSENRSLKPLNIRYIYVWPQSSSLRLTQATLRRHLCNWGKTPLDKSHQDLKSGSIIRTQALSQGYHYLHLKEKTAAKKTLVEILILNIYSIHCSPFPLHCSKISTDHLFLGMVVISVLITICCSRLMPGGYIGLFWVKAELPPSSLMVFF